MSEYIIDLADFIPARQSMKRLPIRESVVRCKDCKFKAWDDAGMFCRKNIFMGKFEPDGYCAWGKRRNDG